MVPPLMLMLTHFILFSYVYIGFGYGILSADIKCIVLQNAFVVFIIQLCVSVLFQHFQHIFEHCEHLYSAQASDGGYMCCVREGLTWGPFASLLHAHTLIRPVFHWHKLICKWCRVFQSLSRQQEKSIQSSTIFTFYLNISLTSISLCTNNNKGRQPSSYYTNTNTMLQLCKYHITTCNYFQNYSQWIKLNIKWNSL